MCGLGVLKPQWFEDMGELRMLNLEYNRLGLGETNKQREESCETMNQAFDLIATCMWYDFIV